MFIGSKKNCAYEASQMVMVVFLPLSFGNHDETDDYKDDDNDGSSSNDARSCLPKSPTKLIIAVKRIVC